LEDQLGIGFSSIAAFHVGIMQICHITEHICSLSVIHISTFQFF
jgi:hypothetical protein